MGNDISKAQLRLSKHKKDKAANGESLSSSQRSRKSGRSSKNKGKEKEAEASESSTPAAKSAPKVTMDSSAVTLGDAKINNRRDIHPQPVMITDNLSDVRVKYHINPKEIGHGHYGVVRKCMDRETKVWYAIKSIRKSKVGKVDVLKREVALLKECDHPNIIELVEVHEDQKYLHLITELCTGGELFDRIIEKTQSDEGHFSERDAAKLVRCILDAIAYCHDQKGIVHRDLKPENFLFASKEENAAIKIIDFGLSRHDDVKAGIMNTKVGTPYYVAPEVLNREYTKSCDIWSIGVITYILLCGYPPFYGDTDNQIFDSVRTGRFDFPSPDWDGISDAAKDFISSLLKRDPSKRLSASNALEHQWIREQTAEAPTRSKRRQRTSIAHAPMSKAFIKYRDMQKLKKSALGFLACNATNDDIANLKKVFKEIDVNKDGTITLQELDDCLKNAQFLPHLTSDLRNLRNELSLSGEDSLNWRDFIALMMDKNLVMKEDNLRMVFEHFKKSDPDYILASDIIELVGSEKKAMEIMKQVDDNSDGKIDFNEFKKMMEDQIFD
jgi:calcium-dependent protein kinase